jgi:hypothetical protein
MYASTITDQKKYYGMFERVNLLWTWGNIITFLEAATWSFGFALAYPVSSTQGMTLDAMKVGDNGLPKAASMVFSNDFVLKSSNGLGNPLGYEIKENKRNK